MLWFFGRFIRQQSEESGKQGKLVIDVAPVCGQKTVFANLDCCTLLICNCCVKIIIVVLKKIMQNLLFIVAVLKFFMSRVSELLFEV